MSPEEVRLLTVIELSRSEARNIRMHSLLLTHNNTSNVTHDSTVALRAVQHLLALQGQDFGATRYALGIRNPGATLNTINQAFNDGLLVRSWPMRGTVHTVAAEDIGWMQRVTNHRVLKDAPKRRAYLGMSDHVVEHIAELTEAYLRGGKRATRDELSTAWQEGGAELESAWRYHLIWYLCQIGLLTMGPIQGKDHLLVLTDEWIQNPRQLEGDDALREFARGFIRGRGPVTIADFAWWAGLTKTEAKRAFALAEPLMVTVEGEPHYLLNAETLELAQAAPPREVLLLGAFDEHLLGYTNRQLVLKAEHFAEIVPGRNGVFRPTIVHNGKVIGAWRRQPFNLQALSGYEDRLTGLDIAPAQQHIADFYRAATPTENS